MTHLAGFKLVQAFYWLSLGTWFGAMVMLAVAAAVTFRTVRELKPSINAPPYNTPARAERAPVIIAGNIVGNTLRALAVLQLICAGIAVVCVVLQNSVFAEQIHGGPAHWVNLLRMSLIVVPILIVVVDMRVITPRIWAVRAVMFDAGATPGQREEAKVVFDRLHKLDERVVAASVWLLLAAIFVSAFAFETGPARPAPTPAGIQEHELHRGG